MNPFIKVHNSYARETDEVQQNVVSEEVVNIPQEEVIVSEEKPDKYLEATDKLELQLAIEQTRSSGFELDAMQNKINALRAIIQNYELRLPQLKNELQDLTGLLEEKKSTFAETQNNRVNLMSNISKKYNLKGKWDFDRITGRIKC